MENLKEQYGDSITYAPPFDAQTAALWLTPVSHSTLVLVDFWEMKSFRQRRADERALDAHARSPSWCSRTGHTVWKRYFP